MTTPERDVSAASWITERLAVMEAAAWDAIRFADAVDDEPSDDGDEWEVVDTFGGQAIWTERQEVARATALWKPEGVAAHIALNDPAAVLALVAGLRTVVTLHGPDAEWCGWSQNAGATHREMEHPAPGYHAVTCPTLAALATGLGWDASEAAGLGGGEGYGAILKAITAEPPPGPPWVHTFTFPDEDEDAEEHE